MGARCGRIRELDGVGVGQKQVEQYRAHITELIQVTQLHYPDELDIDTARQYLTHIQLKAGNSHEADEIATAGATCLPLVCVLGCSIRTFAGLRIKRPKGEREGYRPFTRKN